MTKEEALTMIIASIAMEEAALGHIVEAESEKLQYVLGNLPGTENPCATNQEILAVNKSAKDLLDVVMQSQLLLKGKLEKALEAGGQMPDPPCPEPPCPAPPCPRPPCPCPPDPPACGGCCKSAIQLATRCHDLSWSSGTLISWMCVKQQGDAIRWNERNAALVRLDPGKLYALDYTINVRDPRPEGGEGSVSVRMTPSGAFSGALPLYFSVGSAERKPSTLHGSAVLFPQGCQASGVDLALLLNYRDRLIVDQAVLTIVEL